MQRIKIDKDIRSMSEFRTGIASYELMQEKIELLQDVQLSMSQINNGDGISHSNAKGMILKKLAK